jgi:hypothetical protein
MSPGSMLADAQNYSNQTLTWKAFVAFVAEGGDRIMSEHLKRREVLEFVLGT